MIICIKNIIQNAFKYANTDRGVVITISESKNIYKISIIDFGPGISESDKNHVFKSFYRAKNSKKISGFGLGLSITKKIIEEKTNKDQVSIKDKKSNFKRKKFKKRKNFKKKN